MQKELTKKIASYSTLVSAVLLMAEKSAQSQIVYVDYPDTILDKGSLKLDLDNNGVTDFDFRVIHNKQSPEADIRMFDNSFVPLNYHACELNYSTRPMPLDYGYKIKPADRWLNGSSRGGAITFTGYTYNCLHVWAGKGDRYIGVRFGDEQNSNQGLRKHYGWIRVSVNENGNSITIKDWAYNSRAGEKINAGQTTSSKDDNLREIDQSLIPDIFSSGKELYIQNNIGNRLLTVEIYNTIGQLLKSVDVAAVKSTISLETMPAGIYMVKVYGRDLSVDKEVLIN